MRNLTVKRNKAFAACLMKANVYIEDHESSEIKIKGVPCRKLGVLRNGQEKTFTIDDRAAKIFVIADKLSKGYCNDFYQLPEGSFDAVLTGQNKLNTAGNAFRFDNNTDEQALKNRKSGCRVGLVVYLVALIIGIVSGALASGLLTNAIVNMIVPAPQPQTFSADGMSIELTDEFDFTEVEDFNLCCNSNKIAVFAIKQEFYAYEGLEDYSVSEYADLTIANSEFPDSKLVSDGKLNYFDYVDDGQDGKVYLYRAYIFKTDDAFWMVQFTTYKDREEDYKDEFNKLASTITFEKTA